MSSFLGRFGVVILLSSTVALQAAQTQTVRQGVYTEAQATRGQAIYKDRCTSCHGDGLEGRSGPPLTGDAFLTDWNKEPLFELANKVRNTSLRQTPEHSAGSKPQISLRTYFRQVSFPRDQESFAEASKR